MSERIITIGFMTVFLTAPVRMTAPLICAGLGETMSEKVGILSIDMEGVVLGGVFFFFAGTLYSGSLVVGPLYGMASGAMISIIRRLLSIRLARDQLVSRVTINILMVGVASSLHKLTSNSRFYQQIEPFVKLKMPFLGDIPLIGNTLFSQDILTYGIYVLIIPVALFYSRTLKGMAFVAIGENLRAVDLTGIPVYRYQWTVVLLNGALGELGGTYLVLVQMGNFSENMTSGRGYIVLMAIILNRYVLFRMMGTAFIFGVANALQIRFQAIGVPLPTQALAVLPYIITLIALLGSIGRNNAPEALGKPYIRGTRQISGIMVGSPSGLQ